MIEERINLERIPHFNQSEFERRMDDVLQLIAGDLAGGNAGWNELNAVGEKLKNVLRLGD